MEEMTVISFVVSTWNTNRRHEATAPPFLLSSLPSCLLFFVPLPPCLVLFLAFTRIHTQIPSHAYTHKTSLAQHTNILSQMLIEIPTSGG